jgi:hypothetical protein
MGHGCGCGSGETRSVAARRRYPRREKATASDIHSADEGTFVYAQTAFARTASPGDAVFVAPTDAVAMAAPSPNAGALRACADRRWKPGEDAKLTEAVKKHGGNWVVVATCVLCRTNNQCGTRWRRQLDPDISKGTWKPEEDAKLTVAVNEVGKEWVRVAAMVPGRTDTQCRSRWVAYVDPSIKTGRWTAEEDAKLTGAVTELGNDWVRVAALVPGRTNFHCRHRWLDSLDPDIGKGKWTPEEDAPLTEAVRKHGNNWAEVAAMVPGRTKNQCRRRWVDSLDLVINTGRWAAKEDAKLTDAVKEHGGYSIY